MNNSFTTVCAPERLSDIRRFLHRVLAEIGVAESVKQEIVLAVDEACANAIIHGNHCDETRHLLLEVKQEDDKLVVEISDVGSFESDLAAHRDRNIEDLIAQRRKGGLGLKLIYTIMDQVDYYREGSRNIVALTKRLRLGEA